MNKKLIWLFGFLFGGLLWISAENTVSAAEQVQLDLNYENVLTEKSEYAPVNFIALPDKIGETIVVMEDNDGGKLLVTLIDANESISRSVNRTSTKAFLFTYEDIFGIKKEAFSVSLYCDWIEDGLNSQMTELRATCDVKSDKFTCTWIDSHQSIGNSWWDLSVVKGADRNIIRFGEILNVVSDPPRVEFGAV